MAELEHSGAQVVPETPLQAAASTWLQQISGVHRGVSGLRALPRVPGLGAAKDDANLGVLRHATANTAGHVRLPTKGLAALREHRRLAVAHTRPAAGHSDVLPRLFCSPSARPA